MVERRGTHQKEWLSHSSTCRSNLCASSDSRQPMPGAVVELRRAIMQTESVPADAGWEKRQQRRALQRYLFNMVGDGQGMNTASV